MTRFTFDAAVDGFPLWSPDGARIAFESIRKGSYDIWIKPSSMAGPEELLLGTMNNEWPDDWSKDGRFLLYYQNTPQTGSDLWALPMTGDDRKPRHVATTPFDESFGQFSPDGRWVTYQTESQAGLRSPCRRFRNRPANGRYRRMVVRSPDGAPTEKNSTLLLQTAN